MDLEKVVNSEIDTLVDLKRQIRTTVDTVANVNGANGPPLPLHPQHDLGADWRRVERR